MLFKVYLACLAFIAPVLATPYKRDGTISVQTRIGPPEIQFFISFIDLPLIETVTNTGIRIAKILKYDTVLDDKLPTKSFVVTKGDNPVSFVGKKSLLCITSKLPAPERTSSNIIANFLVDNSADSEISSEVPEISKVQATNTNSVEVTIHGDISKREWTTLDDRATDICTTAFKKSFIDASYTEGKTLASTLYITDEGSSNTLYKAYFETTSTSKVTSILNAIANENSSSRTLSYVDSCNACSNVIAYTLIATTNIHFYSIFFSEIATVNLCPGTTDASRNVCDGTTLYELTHAVGNTDDVTYGCSADQAFSNFNKAINADNYNCFTTQVYANTKCWRAVGYETLNVNVCTYPANNFDIGPFAMHAGF